MAPDALLAGIARVLRPGGSVAAVLPGRDRRPPPEATGKAVRSDELLALARRRFPDGHVAVEVFGNTETVAAVAAEALASEVHGVSIDDHDGRTEVVLSLLVGPCRSAPISRDGE